jgi:hypothetical protein
MYINENLNPLKRKVGDCVIRALAKALDKSWTEVYEELVSLGRKNYCCPNDKEAYHPYLSKFPCITVFYTNDLGNKKRLTVDMVSKWQGTYIISIAGHITCVKDHGVYDIWDCRCKTAYKIWKIN